MWIKFEQLFVVINEKSIFSLKTRYSKRIRLSTTHFNSEFFSTLAFILHIGDDIKSKNSGLSVVQQKHESSNIKHFTVRYSENTQFDKSSGSFKRKETIVVVLLLLHEKNSLIFDLRKCCCRGGSEPKINTVNVVCNKNMCLCSLYSNYSLKCESEAIQFERNRMADLYYFISMHKKIILIRYDHSLPMLHDMT